ncbi:ABC transporter ATP-binding protein [Bdellovibrionales bacterium]|nr:ABC transporter ATP-binding protein [Bdellovibrionales bacterium]
MSKSSRNIELSEHPFRFYFRRYRKLTTTALVCVVFTNVLDSLIPLFIGDAIDLIAQQADIREVSVKALTIFLVAMGLASFRYFWRIMWGSFHNKVAHDLRQSIFNKLTFLGPSFYKSRPVGELMSLITNDVQAFRMGIGPGTLILFDGLFYLFLIPPLMYSISPSWTLKTLCLMPLIPFVMARLMKLIQSRFRQQQDRFSELSGLSQEMASGVRVIKSYAQEKNQTSIFNRLSRRYEISCNDTAQADALFHPIMGLGVTVGAVILVFIGAPEVISGEVTVGGFFAFYQYIQKMIWPVTALGTGSSMRSQATASFKRIKEVLNAPIDRPDSGDFEIIDFEELKVKDLSFTFPGEERAVLKNISFTLRSGETLGVVGKTGSGKTTLVDLLARTYPVPSGTIFYNGRSIEELKLRNLRNNITLIPQESFLFSASVRDNIQLDRTYLQRDIEAASQFASVHSEILAMTEGYASQLGERGINLSGGQKQRLSMARALIRRSPVVIFDDSLSAVDANTEKQILSELKESISSPEGLLKTTIIVSHRLSAVQWADRIIVLNDGEMEAIGSHQELLKSSPTYQNLYMLQNEGGGRESGVY